MFFFSGYVLDPDRAELRGPNGSLVALRPKAFELLKLLVINNRRLVGKQDLLDAVWPGVHVGEDSLFQCIREIRTALGDDQRQLVKLFSGRGYLLAADVSDSRDAMPPEEPSSFRPVADTPVLPPVSRPGSLWHKRPWPWPLATLVAVAGAAILAVVIHNAAGTSDTAGLTLEVLPIIETGDGPQGTALSRSAAAQLIGGLSKIEGLHLVSAPEHRTQDATAQPVDTSSAALLLRTELRQEAGRWTLQARLLDTASREVQSVADVTAGAETPKEFIASRLAAGVGYAVALRLNEMRDAAFTENRPASVAIDQALASINQTTRERFLTARTILEKDLSDNPKNVEVRIALASLHLRAVAMDWYDGSEKTAAEKNARSLLESAVQARPNSASVLSAYCRLLTISNQFTDSLVACGRALALNPWDGVALNHLGLTQLQLGRLEDALATFTEADRYDTPEVSRWTWLLGAGWACLLLDRNEEALGWLQRSVAITPASGRTQMLIATALQRLGQTAEAKDALGKSLELRPGATSQNISLSPRNASEIYLQARRKINKTLVEIGLPQAASIPGE